MKKLLAALLLVFAFSGNAVAGQEPRGTFTMSLGPYYEGQSIQFEEFVKGVTNQYEVTLGTRCFQPDGTYIIWGPDSGFMFHSGGNPYIGEFNYFGAPNKIIWAFNPPVLGTGYHCTSTLITAKWFKGIVTQAWTLDTKEYDVLQ